MTKVFLILVWLYQKTFSPDHSWRRIYYPYGCCSYHPTCSEYSRQSLAKYGWYLGLTLTIKRLIKCRPGHLGGYDPVSKI